MLSSLWTTGSRMLSSWTTANLSLAHLQSSCRRFLQTLPADASCRRFLQTLPADASCRHFLQTLSATLINEDLYFVLKLLTSIFDLQIIRRPEDKRYIAGEWCLAGGGVGGGGCVLGGGVCWGGGGNSSSWVIMFFQPQHHSVVQTDA